MDGDPPTEEDDDYDFRGVGWNILMAGGEGLRRAAPIPPVPGDPPSSRARAPNPAQPHMAVGEGVGLGPEELSARAAVAQAQAAATQAYVATQELAHRCGTPADLKHAKDPMSSHPQYQLRRAVMLGCGSHKSNIAPDEGMSESFTSAVMQKFEKPARGERSYQLGHHVTVGMVVHMARGDFHRVNPDEFTKQPVKLINAAPSVFKDLPLKFAPAPKQVTDIDLYYGCVRRVARFLSPIYHAGAGEQLLAFNEAVYVAVTAADSVLRIEDYRNIISEGLLAAHRAVLSELQRVDSKAQQLGKPPLGGGGVQALQTLRDIGLVPHKSTGQTFIKPPFAALEGVLAEYVEEKTRQINLAVQELGADKVAAQVQGALNPKPEATGAETPTHYAKGPGPERSLTQRERKQAVRSMAFDAPSKQPMCLWFAAHDGCRDPNCGFAHVLPATLALEAALVLVERGGSRVGGAPRIPPAEASAARRALRAKISAAGGRETRSTGVADERPGQAGINPRARPFEPLRVRFELGATAPAQPPGHAGQATTEAAAPPQWLRADGERLPPAVLAATVDGVSTADTHHVLEQALGEEARATPGQPPELLRRVVEPPVTRFSSTAPDTERMQQTRRVAAALDEFSPELVQAPDNHRALVYEIARQRVAAGQPLDDPGALLAAGLNALARSSLPGAARAAAQLRPPSRVAGTPGPLLASRSQDKQGKPIFLAYPQEGCRLKFLIGGEMFVAEDHGHCITTHAGELADQCVIKALAASTHTDPAELYSALHASAVQADQALGPMGAAVSEYELQLRRVVHDFLTGSSHDLFLTRFVQPALFESYRFIFICASASGQTAVQVVQSATFDPAADGASTKVILTYRGHAFTVQSPSRFTSGTQGAELSRWGGQALLRRLESLVDVQTYNHVSLTQVLQAPRAIPTSTMEPCNCCGLRLNAGPSTRAGRNGGGSPLANRALGAPPFVTGAPPGAKGAPLGVGGTDWPGVRTWVRALAKPSAQGAALPLARPLPYPLEQYVAEIQVSGGLTQESLDAAYRDRSEDCRKHVRSVEATRAFPTAPETKEAAEAMLAAARTAYGQLDRTRIQAGETKALEALGQGLKEVAVCGDRLVAMAGGVRAAAAAYRQAYLATEGNMPLSESGVELLKDLVRPPELDALRGLAAFGAPTLQAVEPPATVFNDPYPTAHAAAGDLGHTALKDAAAARTLLMTGASRGKLAEAGATISALGAVHKKDALGVFSGTYRAVTDLRPLNKFIAEHVELQRALSRLRAPQAVCPRIQQVMRTAVVLALRYPGVDIVGGKSDLSEAFKLVHVLLADVPSFGWKLPHLPGLEALEIFQLLMVLPFGWDKSPGWFGLLAWVLAQAHAALGPDEPHLNGGDSFAGGLPWVDDYVFLTPALGQRAKLAYEAYVHVAVAGAGVAAINLPKDRLAGPPRLKFEPWGYIVDLTDVAAGGPLKGVVMATREKVLKLLNQLTGGGFSGLRDRRLTLKALEETTGLAVWLAQTNPLLQALLGSYYNALNSRDPVYVAPAGSAQNVSQVWTELEEAVYLTKQLCLDFETFKAAFTASVTRALSPLEQVALGVPRQVWQTDSTGKDPLFEGGKVVQGPDGKPVYKQGVFSLALFGLKVWGAALVEDYEVLLQRVVRLDRETHIVVGEMLPVVAAAMEHGEELRGCIVTCLVDNTAVVSALNKRASGHPFVRYLSLLLARLESLHGFQLVAYYINTKRNVLADDISRKFLELSAEELQAHVDTLHPGLERREYGKLLSFLLRQDQATARTFFLLDELSPAAEAKALEQGLARAARREAGDWREAACGVAALPETARVKGGFVELFGGIGTMARAAVRVGLSCKAVVEKHAPSRKLNVERLKEAAQDPVVCADIFEEDLLWLEGRGAELLLVGSAPPAAGAEPNALLEGLPSLTERLQPLVVCVELVPDGGRLGDSTMARALIEAMAKADYSIRAPPTGRGAAMDLPFEVVDTAELGGGQQRHRAVLLFEPKGWEHLTGPLPELRPALGPHATLGSALRPLEEIEEQSYVEGRFVSYAPPEDDTSHHTLLAGHLFTKDSSVGVGIGSEVALVSNQAAAQRAEDGQAERWTVVALQGGDGLVLEKKARRGTTGGERRAVSRDDVAEHHGRRLQVWHPRGVSATVRASWEAAQAGAPLVLETRGATPRVRRLNVQELWRLQGLSDEDLKLFGKLNKPRPVERKKQGARGHQVLTAAGRATPTVLAEAVVARAAERMHTLQARLRLAPSLEAEPRYERVELLRQGSESLVRRADGTVGAVAAASIIPYDPLRRGALVSFEGFDPARVARAAPPALQADCKRGAASWARPAHIPSKDVVDAQRAAKKALRVAKREAVARDEAARRQAAEEKAAQAALAASQRAVADAAAALETTLRNQERKLERRQRRESHKAAAAKAASEVAAALQTRKNRAKRAARKGGSAAAASAPGAAAATKGVDVAGRGSQPQPVDSGGTYTSAAQELRLAPSLEAEPRYERVELLGQGSESLVRRADGTVEVVAAASIIPYDPLRRGALVPLEGQDPPSTRASGGKRRDGGRCPAVAPGTEAAQALKQAAALLLANSINDNSTTTYESQWKNHWAAWTALRGIPLYLDGKDPAADEEELVLFVAHKAMVSLYAHGTIHVMLYALRRKHLLARYPDPLEDKLLVKMAMKGIWRLQGGPLRKIPCSMGMLNWLADQLDWNNWDEFVVLLAAVFMFLFLLRSREALRKGPEPDAKQCVRLLNVIFFRKGSEVTGEAIQSADEVVLMQGESKTDPNGQGSVANHFEAPGERLCVVALLKRAHSMNPALFAKPDNFLFTMSDGRVLHRDVMAKHLSASAVAAGAPPRAAAVISLRSGGATAMWDADMPSEEIKQRGRWTSDCYQIYIWPGHDRSRNVAARMLASRFSLMASLAAYRRHE